MILKYSVDPVDFRTMTTHKIREKFLLDELFVPDEVRLYYSEIDRAIVGGAFPKSAELQLRGSKRETGSDYFNSRRELGIINVGGNGSVIVDNKEYELEKLECLYIGKGDKTISFKSLSRDDFAKFYFVSYPAHIEYPDKKIGINDAEVTELGSQEMANKRTIYKYIHPNGITSCQLVMGITILEKGNVWNTMPPHTHQRRSEVYMYFDVEDDSVVFHYMGEPSETRHIVVRNLQAVISPIWSIHSGCGTKAYKFVWAMGGENQEFDDMDGITIDDIL
ncbi:MAG: 5-dehydro-4-deoxy-D-glucuronate isomerase [Candidatus Marinimicrobia bacterium]|nr:5-dehydro-4-deoxy-D-glucuronate isomerase [Candidatus Neomarinimicrobiota bacterium]